jgi:hypothetical protein
MPKPKSQPTTDDRAKARLLSALWTFLSVNYVFCDVVSGMEAATVRAYLSGNAGNVAFTPGMLAGATLMMNLSFAMIVLPLVLPPKANRWTNIAIGLLMALIQLGSLGMGPSVTAHYWVSTVIEVATALGIAWLAFRWRPGSAGR